MFDWSMPTMLANWARFMAASSSSMSVAMSRPETTRAKSSRFSLAMPSCPPSASALRMSSAETGWTLLISMAPCLSASRLSASMSTVLRTLVKAVSRSVAACTATAAPATMGTVTLRVRLSPMSAICCPAL